MVLGVMRVDIKCYKFLYLTSFYCAKDSQARQLIESKSDINDLQILSAKTQSIIKTVFTYCCDLTQNL